MSPDDDLRGEITSLRAEVAALRVLVMADGRLGPRPPTQKEIDRSTDRLAQTILAAVEEDARSADSTSVVPPPAMCTTNGKTVAEVRASQTAERAARRLHRVVPRRTRERLRAPVSRRLQARWAEHLWPTCRERLDRLLHESEARGRVRRCHRAKTSSLRLGYDDGPRPQRNVRPSALVLRRDVLREMQQAPTRRRIRVDGGRAASWFVGVSKTFLARRLSLTFFDQSGSPVQRFKATYGMGAFTRRRAESPESDWDLRSSAAVRSVDVGPVVQPGAPHGRPAAV